MESASSAPPLLGQVAVVTGGGRGLGRSFASALAAAGAAVAVTGRDTDALSATAGMISMAGGRAAAFAFDVTDPEAVAYGMSEIEATLGAVDVLVNNAGVWGPIDNLWEADPAAWWG